MFTARRTRYAAATVAVSALALSLAACSSDDDSSSSGASGAGNDKKTVSIGIPSGWDEGTAVSMLWKKILEDKGYTVKTQTAVAGVVFTGLAGGQFDLMFDTWLPNTHKSYVDRYKDKLVDLGTWYDNAKLTIAVPDYSPAKTIDDLNTMSNDYDNRLVGIEAGAGETSIVKNNVIPSYGLQDMDFVISSTPAMLAELKGALQKKQNIAVTLWRPHWAYNAYPNLRDLDDPKNELGDAEQIHTYGPKSVTSDFPTMTSWIKNFKLTDDQLFSLENLMFNDPAYKDKNAEAVKAWLDKNPNFESSLTK